MDTKRRWRAKNRCAGGFLIPGNGEFPYDTRRSVAIRAVQHIGTQISPRRFLIPGNKEFRRDEGGLAEKCWGQKHPRRHGGPNPHRIMGGQNHETSGPRGDPISSALTLFAPVQKDRNHQLAVCSGRAPSVSSAILCNKSSCISTPNTFSTLHLQPI